jgi:hypothetical protein
LGSAVLFVGAAAAFGIASISEPGNGATQVSGNPKQVLFAGLITDGHCGARHDMDSHMSPAECTKMCVRNGAKYLLVEGDNRYALAGSAAELEGLAGQRANVSGILDGNTIKISSTSAGQ